MTPMAIFGLSAGAKAVKTASGLGLAPFSRFCAVPVFPAICRPFSLFALNANAVPCGCCTTATIICFTLLATAGLTDWLNTDDWVDWTTARSEAVTCWIRYGFISVPLLAIAAENIASCSGVTVSLYWPMAENAVSARLGGTRYWLGATVTPGISRLALFIPNLSAMFFSAPPPRFMPSLPNVVSQDCENAWMIVVWPLASALPHSSPLSLCSLLTVCGSVSTCGESTMLFVVRLMSWVNHEALVTILNVEPGGRVVCVAWFSSGLGFCLSSAWSFLFSWALS